jgi:hypothetical protein
VVALSNPDIFVERHRSNGELLASLSKFLSALLIREDILGDVSVCDFPFIRARAEKFLEIISAEAHILEATLSDSTFYKQLRNNNLEEIAKQYNVDPFLSYYLDMRYSGITVLGQDASLRYVKEGKYQTTVGLLEDDIFFFARRMFLGETPYVYSEVTKKLYYYGKELPFACRIFKTSEGFADTAKSESKHWYFKQGTGQEGVAIGSTDFRYLTINFRDFCTNMCPFCWRVYAEKARFFGIEHMKRQNISVDDGIKGIKGKYGSDVFTKVEKISIIEGGFENGEEEVLFLEELITKLRANGFRGSIGTSSAFIEDPKALEKLHFLGYDMEECFFPLECFTSRNKALGGNKRYTFEEALGRM